ncbi:PCYCGC motif-containing (lipo)protein [Peribacillus frigoritolerans]
MFRFFMIALFLKIKKMEYFVWDGHGTKCGGCLEMAAQSTVDYIK